MGLFSLNIYNENKSPLVVFGNLIIGAVIVYLGYKSYIHLTEFQRIQNQTYSAGGQIVNLLLIPVTLVMLIVSFVYGIALVVAIFKLSIVAMQNGPRVLASEFEIIKRIWDNRGFGKYSLFGGLGFYLKLRQRVLAYFFAFVSLGIVTWFFAFKQSEYEKTYWKVSFYQHEPTPHFMFKPNVPYTMKSGATIYAISINGQRYVTGKSTSWSHDINNKIPLDFPEIWNITFPDTTMIHFEFYADNINQIFSQSFELWVNKKEGVTIPLSAFTYEWQKQQPKETKTTQKNKRTKKKRR